MMVFPAGKIKLSHLLLGSDGIGQAMVGTPVRVIETEDEQLSSAVATPSSSSRSAEHELVVAVTSAGTLSVGGVVSLPVDEMLIVCKQDTTRPMSSVAVQVITV